MGFFDDLFGQPFGGMFDFNGDGKTDFGESWLGYKIIEDCMKEEKDDDPYSYSGSSFASSLDDEDSDGDVDWRLFADEGDEYGVDPYDFDTVDIKKVYSTSTTISGDIEDVVDELKKLTNKDEDNE